MFTISMPYVVAMETLIVGTDTTVQENLSLYTTHNAWHNSNYPTHMIPARDSGPISGQTNWDSKFNNRSVLHTSSATAGGRVSENEMIAE